MTDEAAAQALPEWALDLIHSSQVGHLATVGSLPGLPAEPYVVPVCFVLLDGSFWIAIDEKPKSGRRLQRLRNIEATGRASLLVDHYDEDWTRLAWVLARGAARVVQRSAAPHAPAVAGLREKYPPYRMMALEDAALIELRVERWSLWRASE